MNKFLWFSILALFICHHSEGQSAEGKVVTFQINSRSLENTGGESTTRNVSVYLPPNYDASADRYPVIYYLHGYTGKDTIYPGMKAILDEAVQRHKIRPFILVQADSYTAYGGSFYSNSVLTGNWEDFLAKDLVAYVDSHFRTHANRESRGIAGHSMGGYGSFKIGMLYPEVFSSIYALSPGLLALVKEYGPNSTTYKEIQKIETLEALKKTYFPIVMTAVARAWSPNPDNPPFYCDFPFTYKDNQLVVHQEVLDKWEANMPLHMLDKYADNLRKMKAIKLDWGRNDSPRFPVQIGMLSQQLENLGIDHFAEEYIGNHVNKIWTKDGRILNDMLPFFDDYLKF